ncbi:hypothetical protein [Arthrobacter silvisoli]|uniref:hypothetical protein n=1 Tax=Arthrobacter silvisoli TaxID=2291022 RepID=UPI00109BD6F5|nr:hypothetical protein [Arthrobacter silvisoli]
MKSLFAALAAVGICLTAVPAASAAPREMTEDQTIDAVLDANYWSKATPASAAQKTNRKALPLDVKKALVAVSEKKALTAEQSGVLTSAGLGELDPKNTTWKFSEVKTVAVPVKESPVASPFAISLATARCWISTAEVQKWSFATQSFGWKRQVDWCADGTKVTSRHRDFPSVGYTDFTFHYRGASDIQANAVGGWQVRTYQSGTFEQCPWNLGCTSTYRPWIEFYLYGNSTQQIYKGV